MSWNLTRKTPPEELAALSGEVVHQRRIGTAIADGASVCDQTGVQCSTSQTGEGVTCPLCLVHVERWRAEREAEKIRRENTVTARRANDARKRRRQVKEQGFVSVSHMLAPNLAEDLDLLVEAGVAKSRRNAFELGCRLLVAENQQAIARARLARVARQDAIKRASLALEFAGVTPDAPKASRHSTALKSRLMSVLADAED